MRSFQLQSLWCLSKMRITTTSRRGPRAGPGPARAGRRSIEGDCSPHERRKEVLGTPRATLRLVQQFDRGSAFARNARSARGAWPGVLGLKKPWIGHFDQNPPSSPSREKPPR